MSIRGYQLLALMALGLIAYTHATCDLMTGCDDCVDPDPACLKCSAGKFPSSDTDMKNECEECTGNCVTCASATTCEMCAGGYVLKADGTCEACSSDCVTCAYAEGATESTCSKCSTGKYVDTGACKSCPSNCDSCSNKDTCSTCSTGYVKNSDGTAASGKQCLACDSTTCTACSGEELNGAATCTACKADKYLNTGVCSACSDTDCTTCSTTDGSSSTCEVDGCKAGFYKKAAASNCADCPYKCDECDLVSGSASCTDCKDNYGIRDGKTCDACDDANCKTCHTDGACSACNDGYFVDGTTCKACGTNCDVCDDAATCTDCSTGYFLDFDVGSKKICVSCSDSTTTGASGLDDCVACADTATGINTVCSACATGFSVKTAGAACLTCAVDDCDICVAVADECSTCSAGFLLNAGNKNCPDECKAVATLTNCITCVLAGTCSACADGYILTDATHCDACGDANCQVCSVGTTTGSCTTCMAGYAKTATGTCVACPANCGAYQSGCDESGTTAGTSACTICLSGYEAKDGVCVACPPRCSACTADATSGEMVCDSNGCNDENWLNSHQCAVCPGNCEDCTLEDGNMVCSVCADGYAKNSDNDCKKCPSNCKECSAGTAVTCKAGKCDVGYGVSADKTACTGCAALTTVDNCATCKDSNSTGFAECLSCAVGYFIQDDHMKCLEAFTGCMQSVDKSVECNTCDQGYNVTEDKTCFVMCNLCGGLGSGLKSVADCNAAGTEYTSAMCFGTCWTEYEDKEGTVTAARGCSTDECTSEYLDTEACSEVDEGKTKQCKSCCTEDNCNSKILDGKAGLSGSHAGIITANLWLLLVSVLALLTR